MEVNKISPIDPSTDLEKILPIHQKRIITFINHFLTSTVSFLNNFAQSCESRFMEFEYKIQKVEASLLILESQLSSIPNLDSSHVFVDNSSLIVETKVVDDSLDLPEVLNESESVEVVESNAVGPKACEDARFKKFFKMIQFGVPVAAVKLKMDVEGVDSSVLDKPNDVIPGYSIEVE